MNEFGRQERDNPYTEAVAIMGVAIVSLFLTSRLADVFAGWREAYMRDANEVAEAEMEVAELRGTQNA